MKDDFPKARTHILVLTKRHIKNYSYMKRSDSDLLKKMI